MPNMKVITLDATDPDCFYVYKSATEANSYWLTDGWTLCKPAEKVSGLGRLLIIAHGADGKVGTRSKTGLQLDAIGLLEKVIDPVLHESFKGEIYLCACETAGGNNSFVKQLDVALENENVFVFGMEGAAMAESKNPTTTSIDRGYYQYLRSGGRPWVDVDGVPVIRDETGTFTSGAPDTLAERLAAANDPEPVAPVDPIIDDPGDLSGPLEEPGDGP